MIKKMLKHILVYFIAVMISFTSYVDIAFSQVKKTTKKSVRKANTGAKKSSSKKTARAGSRKRAATGGNARTRLNTRRAATTSSLASKIGKNLSESASSQKVEEQKCREAFVSCMDSQINDVIDKYTYLYDDEAVQAYLDTQEPFRCLFYDRSNSQLPQNMQVVSSCRSILNESTLASFSIAQDNINSYINNQFSSYLTSATCSASGDATLTLNTKAKTGICATCEKYKTLNAFLSANKTFDNNWKTYQKLCKEKVLVNTYKDSGDLQATSSEYQDFVNSNCSARDVNDLYFAYNYYCDLRNTTLKSAIGVKTNYCVLSSEDTNTDGLTGDAKVRAEIANVFGTTSSAEYYKEALKRLDSGELKMVNFTNSELYKQRIEGLGLETLKTFDISSLLNTSTKCSDGYKYNASVGACQLYDSENKKYFDANVSTAEFVSTTSSSSQACPLENDTYDSLQKKCARCPVGSTWNELIRKCQGNSTCGNSQACFVASQQEEEKDARSIYTDLGINRDSSLFSINVVPPLGAGLVFPSALFNRASNYCFDGKTKSLSGVSSTVAQTYREFNKNKTLLASCKATYKADLERYYLSGFWPKSDVEPSSDGTYNTNTDYAELDFMSAKKSCDMYEANLISVRDTSYAKFDTQIKNYLEDALAVIIKNKVKDITTISDVANSLKKDDATRTINTITAKAELAQQKVQTAIDKANYEMEANTTKTQQDKQYLANVEKMKSAVMETNGTGVLNKCSEIGSQMTDYFVNHSSSISGFDFVNALKLLTVKANSSGNVYVKPNSAYGITGDANYDALSNAEYPELTCVDLPDFDKSNAMKNIQTKIREFSFEHTDSQKVKMEGGSGTLSAGVYKVVVQGAGGGGGGGVYGCAHTVGGAGGWGQYKYETFIVVNDTAFTYEVGKSGGGGSDDDACHDGDDGKKGGSSSFTIPELVSIVSEGGNGGKGLYTSSEFMHCACHNGDDAKPLEGVTDKSSNCSKSGSRHGTKDIRKGGCGDKNDNYGWGGGPGDVSIYRF